MRMMDVELSILCGHCGDGRVSAPCDDRDDAVVRCPSCNTELGVWAEVKEQARAAMFDALRDDFTFARPRSSEECPSPAADDWAQAA